MQKDCRNNPRHARQNNPCHGVVRFARLIDFISNGKGHQYTHHLVVLACDDTVLVGKNGPVTRVAALTNLNWA